LQTPVERLSWLAVANVPARIKIISQVKVIKMDKLAKKKLFRRLLWLFTLSYLLSNGPGILLVNKPVLVRGMALLYVWALFWGIAQIGIILYAYFKLWKDEADEYEPAPPITSAGGEGA